MLKNAAHKIPEHHEKFLQLFLPLRHRLHRFACALTQSREEGLDLTGDTILAALENYNPDLPEESFRSYLFTIAVRIHRRGRKRRERIRRLDDLEAENERSRLSPPDLDTDIRALREALARLPLRQQEAVVLFELSDMSLQEIRKIQGGSLSGVKSRIVRGRKRLAELLGVEPDLPQSLPNVEKISIEPTAKRDGSDHSPRSSVIGKNAIAISLEANSRKR